MRVLLTRPMADSERLAPLLQARGHEPVLSPVMQIRFLGGPPPTFEGVQTILLTSANGVRALARRTSVRDVQTFTVGPQTLEAAREAGFTNVEHVGGTASALANRVLASLRPDDGMLLLATGRERTGDLDKALAAAGFAVRVEELYEANEIPQLSAEAGRALAEEDLDAVMLFSPRSACLFVRQIQSARLEEKCARLFAFCISEATAAALSPLRFADCRTAARPDRDAMLHLLDGAAARARTRSRP